MRTVARKEEGRKANLPRKDPSVPGLETSNGWKWFIRSFNLKLLWKQGWGRKQAAASSQQSCVIPDIFHQIRNIKVKTILIWVDVIKKPIQNKQFYWSYWVFLASFGFKESKLVWFGGFTFLGIVNLTNWVHDGTFSSSVNCSASRTVLLAKEETFVTLSLGKAGWDQSSTLFSFLQIIIVTWKRTQALQTGVWLRWEQMLAAKVLIQAPLPFSETAPQVTFTFVSMIRWGQVGQTLGVNRRKFIPLTGGRDSLLFWNKGCFPSGIDKNKDLITWLGFLEAPLGCYGLRIFCGDCMISCLPIKESIFHHKCVVGQNCKDLVIDNFR